MKKITVEVGFNTDHFSDVSYIELELSNTILDKIKKAILSVRDENSPINQATIWYDGELLNSDKETSNFKSDGGELLVFSQDIYYKTQSKYEASIQIESLPINVSDLFTERELTPPNPVQLARELLRENGYFVQNLWSSQDVIEHGKDVLNVEISEEQAIEIFDLLGRRFDATIGVNWDMLEAVIEEYFNN